MPLIELSKLSKSFNKHTQLEIKSLVSIDLSIEKGENVVLVGANGSGKSTLLNVIAGTLKPDSGILKIHGASVGGVPEYKRSRWISRVHQNPLMGSASDLSILDNFRLASIRTRVKGLAIGTDRAFKKKVIEQIATLNLGLENKVMQRMGSLSGGQRQALTLLMAVMDKAEILLMDEPTAALDPRSSETVLTTAARIIKQYQLTSIMVTHNLKDAWAFGERVILIKDGRIDRDIHKDPASFLESPLNSWFE